MKKLYSDFQYSVSRVLLLLSALFIVVWDAAGQSPEPFHKTLAAGRSFDNFTEVSPLDSVFQTPANEDFWTVATAPADYDNDGDLDIAVLGYYVVYNVSADDRLILMRNDGSTGDTWNFTYINLKADYLYAGTSDLAWGDADNDGDLDLAVGSEGQTYIFLNDAGTLSVMPETLPGYHEENSQAYYDLRSISWADFDNDGDMDLLLPSVLNEDTFEYQISLMRNDSTDSYGNVHFSLTAANLSPSAHAISSWADSDNDQDLDLLLINIDPLTEESYIKLYNNNGSGAFTGEDILVTLTIEHGEAQWGDYDNDGDLDILVAGNLKETDGQFTPVNLRIYRNMGATYDTVNIIPCPTCDWFDIYAASWADYDSDGDMDILVAGSYNSGSEIEGRARILLNENGTYIASGTDLPAPHASGDRGGTFSWLDMDNDGDLDYFIAGEYFVPGGNGLVEAQMHLYRNDTPIANLAPEAPGGIQTAPMGESGIMISWNESSDDHTPPATITYDLEIYHDNVPVGIPARLPEPGNVNAVNEWMLTDLQDGTYQYTIKAVDASYTGSSPTTGTFTIGTVSMPDLPAPLNLNATIYPNPSYGNITVQFNLPSLSPVNISLYNVTGERIINRELPAQASGTYNVELNTANINPGVYLIRVLADQGSAEEKLVIR